MGKRHREARKKLKVLAFKLGYKENEFGELRFKLSKRQAKEIFVRNRIFYKKMLHLAEKDIINSACKKAREDILAIEDNRIFAAWSP